MGKGKLPEDELVEHIVAFKNEQDGNPHQTEIMRNYNKNYERAHHKRMRESEKKWNKQFEK